MAATTRGRNSLKHQLVLYSESCPLKPEKYVLSGSRETISSTICLKSDVTLREAVGGVVKLSRIQANSSLRTGV